MTKQDSKLKRALKTVPVLHGIPLKGGEFEYEHGVLRGLGAVPSSATYWIWDFGKSIFSS